MGSGEKLRRPSPGPAPDEVGNREGVALFGRDGAVNALATKSGPIEPIAMADGHASCLQSSYDALSGALGSKMEVLSERDVNSAVWDFGVHPTAPENKDVMKPQPKRPVTLEHRDR